MQQPPGFPRLRLHDEIGLHAIGKNDRALWQPDLGCCDAQDAAAGELEGGILNGLPCRLRAHDKRPGMRAQHGRDHLRRACRARVHQHGNHA